MTNVNIGVP